MPKGTQAAVAITDDITPAPAPVKIGAPTDHFSGFSWEQLDQLAAKLSPDLVSDRQGLSYLEAHNAIRHANLIFGYGNWQRNKPEFTLVYEKEEQKGDKKQHSLGYICSLSVTVFGTDRHGNRIELATTWGTGFGDGLNMPDRGKAHEFATKEAESDAMKRALIAFGDQFGLALYDKQKRHVGEDEKAPDTFGENKAEVTAQDIRDVIGQAVGSKKGKLTSAVNEFKAEAGVEKIDDLSPDQLKSLGKKLRAIK